jgi:hypothetical protein
VEWHQPRDLVLTDHPTLFPRSAAVRAANCVVNEAQRKAKEDRKKRYEKQVRRDQGEDISDEEEEGEEEGEIMDDVVDIPWDDLAEENEPRDGGSSSQQQAKGDADLTLGNLPLGDPSRSTWDRPSPPSRRRPTEGQKRQRSDEERSGPGGPTPKRSCPVAPR